MFARIIDSKTIHIYDRTQFDWYAIRNSGQIFRNPPCVIVEESDKVVISATGGKSSAELWDFFDLDTDYTLVKAELSCIAPLRKPIEVGGGIRILRQPFEETAICFIISANNNIKRFTKTISQICFGDLTKYTEADFVRMGCGYRSPYLVKSIKRLGCMSFDELSKLDNDALRRQILSLAGVGPKVCDCIMLFAFHRLDVAPVDTWIRKAIAQLDIDDAGAIFRHRYAGIAQQYIFYYMQHLRRELSDLSRLPGTKQAVGESR